MSSGVSPNLDMNYPDPFDTGTLSIALIGPDAERRRAVASALAKWPGAEVREFSSYPPALDDVQRLIELAVDVVMIDVDSNPEYAIQIVENICVNDSATVMVYSSMASPMADPELVRRCMRAGASEYLEPPFDEGTVADALTRAAARGRLGSRQARRTGGRLLAFFGAKGGSGVTTLACNYAIALARQWGQKTLLIDLGMPLGDAALNLGIASEHSTDDALQDANRLDSTLLQALVTRHDSGVRVLPAPSKVPEVSASNAAIDKLMAVARQEFDYVIVDVGSRVDLMNTTLFKEAFRIYMVTQAGITELRNADRLITRYFSENPEKLEIVINRFDPSDSRVTEDQMAKALGTPVRWKIADDYDATRQMQSSDPAQANAESVFSRQIVEMAGSVAYRNNAQEGKKVVSISGFGQSNGERLSSGDEQPDNLSATGETTSTQTDQAPPAQARVSPSPDNPGGLPTVVWPTPEGIIYGTGLSDIQLNATASVPGNFVYTPGAGYVLPVGTHTLWVTFTPANGTMVQSAVSITVAKATPAVTWPIPRPISCDTPLSDTQLNATASVAGTFEYSPASGQTLAAGEQALSVTFTPADSKNYTTARATVSLTVEKLTPSIEWSRPDRIPYGGALGERHLNAKASVPGTFVYSPAVGEVMEPGEHTLSVTFMPADSARYATLQATVSVTVMKAPPRVTWTPPDPIVYGTPLSTGQLNATASVEGTFVYTPGMGALLAVGEHTPSVTFTPKDNSEYSTIQAAVPLSVVMAKPSITWPNPEPISAGTPLSATELHATASVPGIFFYKPAAGEVLGVGTHMLTVSFTPADSMNYEPSKAAVALTVTEVSPAEITWLTPAPISYGTPISEAQQNATASVPGRFDYGPSAGNVLPPGKHTLSVIFTPKDLRKHSIAHAVVTLEVEALTDVASLLTAGTQTQSEQNAVADQSAAAEAEREVVMSGRVPLEQEELEVERPHVKRVVTISPPQPEKPRETRTYKGVIYEKGDDGQWHRQQK